MSIETYMNDSHSNPAGRTSEQELFFDLNEDLEALRRDTNWETKGIARKILVRYPDFHITLMVMKGGKRIEAHQNAGRISVQTVAGHLRMKVGEQVFDMPQGRLLVLDRGVRHDVEAMEDSAFLLSIAVPQHA